MIFHHELPWVLVFKSKKMLQFALVFFAGSKKNKQINGSLPFPFLVEKEQANSHSWLCLLWVRNKSICQWPSVLTRKKTNLLWMALTFRV